MDERAAEYTLPHKRQEICGGNGHENAKKTVRYHCTQQSGLAIRNFFDVGVGVVDSDYQGKIKVVLFSHSAEDFAV